MLTVKDIARDLQVHERTVRRWIADGKLKAFKVGGKGMKNIVRITLEEYQRFLQSQKEEE